MAYTSPFDRMIGASNDSFSKQCYSMECSHPFHYIVDSLLADLRSAREGTLNPSYLANNPPRIIRAAIDAKVDAGNRSPYAYASLVKKATSAGLAAYALSDDAICKLHEFIKLARAINPSIFERIIKQELDTVTWNASHPRRSEYSAHDLAERAHGKDILMIALAHGGISPGMDVFHMYCDKTSSRNSIFYPVRLSTDKKKDTCPQLSRPEVNYLKEAVEDRSIVIFDDDTSSGETMRNAKSVFSSIFGREIIARVNLEA